MTSEERFEIISAFIPALHAQLFGVASQNDPDMALKAISDGGEIHESVHAIIRLLPPAVEPGASISEERRRRIGALAQRLRNVLAGVEASGSWKGVDPSSTPPTSGKAVSDG